MKECWTRNWKKALIWVCGYLSIIAFAVVGGYAIVKSEDAELKQAAKKCFIAVLIFAAIDALLLIGNTVQGMTSYSSASFADFLRWVDYFETIVRIVVFAVFTITALFGKGGATRSANDEDVSADSQNKKDE